MKIYSFVFCFLIILPGCTKNNDPGNADPVIITDNHFRFILYDGLAQDITTPIKTKLDDNYQRVLDDLGLKTMDKVTVHIWNNETNFLNNMESLIGRRYTGSAGWVYSSTDIRILNRNSSTPQITLHEFCHAVSLMVNNRIGNNPRWLWEAIAIYEAGEFTNPKSLNYLVNGNFPTLSELNSDFIEGENKIYSIGYLLSEYIIAKWGAIKFVDMIKSNGNIQQTLEVSVPQFEAGWKVFVTDKYLK